MMLRPNRVPCAVGLAAALMGAAVSARADVDVLLKSGDVTTDGRLLSAFSGVRAASSSKIAFLGGTSALITKIGGVFSAVVKTGDPLPPPLSGTFNSVLDPVINDAGNIAFRATLNSTDAESGLFYCCDAGSIVPIVLTGGTMGGAITVNRPPDINNNPDVVYMLGTDEILIWSLATQTSTSIVSDGMASPGGGTYSRFGDRPVVNDAGRVAFEGEVGGGPDGVFSSAFPYVSIDACALEGAATPIAGGTYELLAPSDTISINAFGYIAFASGVTLPGPDIDAVFACDPTGPTTTTVAQEGDLVGASTLTTIDDEYVGIDDAFNVAFEGVAAGRQLILANGGPLVALTSLGSPSEFAPRLTNAGRVIWRRSGRIEVFDGATTTVVGPSDLTPIGMGVSPREPSINNVDDVVFRASQFGLYLLDRGATTAIAAPGDASPGTGTLGVITSLAYRGSSLAFQANDDGGAVIALKKGHDLIAKVVQSGDPAPGGGTLDVDGLLLQVKGSKVLFDSHVDSASQGLFRTNTQNGQTETLALQNDAAPGGGAFTSFLGLFAAGSDAAFVATIDNAALGIFLTGQQGPTAVIREGDALADTGGGTLGDLGAVAVNGKRVVFTASVDNGTVTDGLFLWNRGQVTRLVSAGDSAGNGMTFSSIFSNPFDSFVSPPLAMASRPAIIAPVTGGLPFEGLFVMGNAGSISTLALTSDPTPIGGTIQNLDLSESIAQVGSKVVLPVNLSAASGASTALVRAKP